MDEKKIHDLIKKLKSKNAEERKDAAKALGNIKGARAVPPLIKAFKDVNKWARSYEVWALRNMGDVKAVSYLIEVLKDENDDVRSYAAKVLGDIAAEKKENAQLVLDEINKSQIDKDIPEIKELIKKCEEMKG